MWEGRPDEGRTWEGYVSISPANEKLGCRAGPLGRPNELHQQVRRHRKSVEIVTFQLQPPWFRSLVPFFDQYAQSVQLWSSSGAYIGYPAVVDAEPVVVIEPLDGINGTEPVIISGATWSAWAPSD